MSKGEFQTEWRRYEHTTLLGINRQSQAGSLGNPTDSREKRKPNSSENSGRRNNSWRMDIPEGGWVFIPRPQLFGPVELQFKKKREGPNRRSQGWLFFAQTHYSSAWS